MKRRKTKAWERDAGHSPLVRAGARWLSFARRLARGCRRVAAADPRAFVESLYGVKFKTFEGGAFALDKVYRTHGGRPFVSETRLSLSIHPRFDLRFVNIAAGVADAQVFRETRTVFGHVLHRPLTEREQQSAVRQGTRSDAAAPSLTAQTWNVSQAVAAGYVPAFGYVSVRGPRWQAQQLLDPTLPASSIERQVRSEGATSPSAEGSRPTVAPSHASLRLTSIDLRQHFTHAPRQEFVSLLLNTYLPAAVSRVVESTRPTGRLLSAPPRRATAQGETARPFAQTAPAVIPELQTAPLTYARTAPRQTPEDRIEISTESRSTETVRELSSTREAAAPLLHLLPPASLLTSLSVTSRTLLAGVGGGTHLAAYDASGRAPALSLQLIRTQAAQAGTREGASVVHATRLDQSVRSQPASTRDVLTSVNTLVGLAPPTVAAVTQPVNTTIFARHRFETMLRTGREQAAARQRSASNVAAQTQATTHGFTDRTVEFVRHTSVAELLRAAPTHDLSSQIPSSHTSNDITTQRTPGAGPFLFATSVTRRAAAAAAAHSLSPTATTTSAAATGHEAKETRAARPEGMALELIRHRREEVLRLPQPGYVFTQPPARAQLEERQVITKASREEIVEVVRKEVRSLASATHTAPAPSRADLAGLADEIYSTLARRLLVEKERLGRF